MSTPGEATTIDPHILGTIGAITAFVQAGNATFTLRNTETGNRVTYKVVRDGPADPKGSPGAAQEWLPEGVTAPENPTYTVYVLTGSDNASAASYALLGHIRDGKYHYAGALLAALALKEKAGTDEWALGFAGSILKTIQAKPPRALSNRQEQALKTNCKRRDIPLSPIPYEDHRQLGFAWLWGRIVHEKDLPEKAQVWHEGRCGACNRPLTVPESIENGLGPVCASRVA